MRRRHLIVLVVVHRRSLATKLNSQVAVAGTGCAPPVGWMTFQRLHDWNVDRVLELVVFRVSHRVAVIIVARL